MRRRKSKPQQRRRRPYRASPLCRHRTRARWLLAQRIRLRNYIKSLSTPGADSDKQSES
ncbi:MULTISPECIES: hypothetical protein [Microbulbifer]|uniref:hypothetical protein n=1 Tax=Microbulbifer TaxID=48073 RepID=UPI000A3F1603|nr:MULTISPECIES: hypothetical protein [Microbulbifer]